MALKPVISPTAAAGLIGDGHRVFNQRANRRQPVIAAVNGFDFGGGLELALAADIRLAGDRAELALPEVQLTAVPGWTGSQRRQASIGAGRAKQMIFSGARVDASTAEQWGLVNEVIPAEDAREGVAAFIEQREQVYRKLAFSGSSIVFR